MLLRWLLSWRRPKLEHLHIVMYTRQGCHLCEGAWERLQIEQRRHGFSLRAVDVDTDPELVALHGNEVPVVTINGRVRFRGVINPVLLTRLLIAECRR